MTYCFVHVGGCLSLYRIEPMTVCVRLIISLAVSGLGASFEFSGQTKKHAAFHLFPSLRMKEL